MQFATFMAFVGVAAAKAPGKPEGMGPGGDDLTELDWTDIDADTDDFDKFSADDFLELLQAVHMINGHIDDMMMEGEGGEMGEEGEDDMHMGEGEGGEDFWDFAGWEPLRWAEGEDGAIHVQFGMEGEEGEGGEVINIRFNATEDDLSDATDIMIGFGLLGAMLEECTARHCWGEFDEDADYFGDLTGEDFLGGFEELDGFDELFEGLDGEFTLEDFAPEKFEQKDDGSWEVIFSEGEGNDKQELKLTFDAGDIEEFGDIDFSDLNDLGIELFDEVETPDFEGLDDWLELEAGEGGELEDLFLDLQASVESLLGEDIEFDDGDFVPEYYTETELDDGSTEYMVAFKVGDGEDDYVEVTVTDAGDGSDPSISSIEDYSGDYDSYEYEEEDEEGARGLYASVLAIAATAYAAF